MPLLTTDDEIRLGSHRCRRALHARHHGVLADVTMTSLALQRTALIRFHVAGAGTVTLDIAGEALVFRRCLPSGEIPGHACERLEFECLFTPAATWLSSAIEGTEASVDGTCISFGSELVRRYGIGWACTGRVVYCTVDSAIWAMMLVSM